MVNYEEALKKPFTDLGKLVLGIILSVIPVVNWIAQGFILECSGLGKSKPSKKMPDWKDFGDFFIKGFLSYVIIFIYMFPAIIVFSTVIGYASGYLFPVLFGMMPEGFLSSLLAGQITGGQIRNMLSQNLMTSLPAIVSVAVTVAPLLMLGLILCLVAVYLSPIAVLNYLKNKKFEKAFDFSFIIGKALTSKYLISWLIAGVISIVLKAVLVPIPWVGVAIAFFISGVIAYSLFGQVFREK